MTMALDYLGRTLDVDDLMADLDQQAEEVQDTRGHLVTLQGVADRVQRIVEAAEAAHGRLDDRDDALQEELSGVLEQLQRLVLVPGPPGLTAFQVACAAGFDGSVQQWLASLQGEDGKDSTVPGPASTVPGPPGLTAFQVAQAAGYTGTVVQWLASLKGKDGTSAVVPAKGAGSVKLTSLLGLGATMVLSLELDATPPAGTTPFVQTMGAPVYLTAWTRTGTTLQLTLAAVATIALGTTVSAQVRML